METINCVGANFGADFMNKFRKGMVMKPKPLLLSTSLALSLIAGQAEADFIGVFHENLSSGPNTLFIFGAEGTSGTISANDGLDLSFTIDASGVFEQGFGDAGRQMSQDGDINTLSFNVEADDPISGLTLNRAPFTTDMTTLLDVDGLGTEYTVLAAPGVFGEGSQMSVTATEDNTVVTIQSALALDGKPANTPFQVTLDAGQSVFYESGGGLDLSGTSVSSTRPVAVFAGAECTQVPTGTVACDHLISQQFSEDNFDTEFRISDNFGGGVQGDLLRITTATDGTEVFFNGVSQGSINAGEVLVIDGVTEGLVTSSEPITVGQFVRGQGGTRTTGDPAFAIIPSVDQELDSYAHATPVGPDAFSQNFLNIAIDQGIANSLMLNGSSVDTSGFSLLDGVLFGNIPINVGFGVISAADGFLATISGFSGFDSYFSPIATAFSPGVSQPPEPPMAPIPLPAAGWLLIAGIGGMAAMKRRKTS